MRRTLTVILVGVLALAFGATAALADSPQTIAPTAKQKTAIIKAWAQGGKTGPAKCYNVRIAKPQKYQALWSGLSFNSKAAGCDAYAFDGSGILYGTGNHFYLLTAGSSMDPSQCTATSLVMGVAWANLVDSGVAALGCENID
jgi:rare lipoprotein A (peptidoglycan hydrolase)